jgi:hypothetical protein
MVPPVPGIIGWEPGLAFHHTPYGVVFLGPRVGSYFGSRMGGVSCST